MYMKEDILLGVLTTIKMFPDEETKTEAVKQIFKPFCTQLYRVYMEQEKKTANMLLDSQKKEHILTIVKNFESLIIIAKNLTPASPDSIEHEMRIILKELWVIIDHFLKFHFVRSIYLGRRASC